jgi:hypothetical protein
LLRTNLVAEDPAVLWDRYLQLTQIEAAFKCLQSELGIRPIYHPLEHPLPDHATLHRAGRGCRAAAASAQADLASQPPTRIAVLSDEPLPPLKM